MQVLLHDIHTQRTETLEGDPVSLDVQIRELYPELSRGVESEEGLSELLEWLSQQVQGLDFEIVGDEPLEKMSKPILRFPKLGFPDDRRETPVVDDLKSIRRVNLAAAQGARNQNRVNPEDVQNFVRVQTPIDNRHLVAPAKMALRDQANGAIPAIGPVTSGFVMSPALMFDREKEKHPGLMYESAARQIADPNNVLATKAHEDLHQMMKRVGDTHGMEARRQLATNLLEHLSLVDPEAHSLLRQTVGKIYNNVWSTPLPEEEHLTTLMNYMNGPTSRWAATQFPYRDPENPDREVMMRPEDHDRVMKRAYRILRDAANKADHSWLSPRDTFTKSSPLEKMAIQDLPAGPALDPVDGPWGQFLRNDYSHLLTPEHRQAGYHLHVYYQDPKKHEHGNTYLKALLLHPSVKGGDWPRNAAGEVGGLLMYPDRTLKVNSSKVEPEHRGGKGQPLYEALFRHAKELGASHVQGDTHSSMASRVHEKLAQKHGLDYVAKPAYGYYGAPYESRSQWEQKPNAPHDIKYAPYAYTLKSEPVQQTLGPPRVPVIYFPKKVVQTQVQKHEDSGADSLEGQHGFGPEQEQVFAAARWLSQKRPSSQEIRQSVWDHGDDLEAAALQAHGLPVTDENRRALQNLINSQGLDKAEPPQIQGPAVAGVPEAQKVAEAITEALAHGKVQPIKLNGKHSQGTFLAETEHGNWLLKPGSGPQSPAAGAREEKASQSRREAAFWHLAQVWGLQDDYPETHLVLIRGREYAAIRLLPFDWKNLSKVAKKDNQRALDAMRKYRHTMSVARWSALDWVAGNPDRHGSNLMISPKNEVKLIDHGSAFAGPDFRPGTDKKSFIPYYLRAWVDAGVFNKMTPGDKLSHMPGLPESVDREFRDWVQGLKPEDLEAVCHQYGINPEPSLARLLDLKQNASAEKLNRLWVES